jgi:hypothetical protein
MEPDYWIVIVLFWLKFFTCSTVNEPGPTHEATVPLLVGTFTISQLTSRALFGRALPRRDGGLSAAWLTFAGGVIIPASYGPKFEMLADRRSLCVHGSRFFPSFSSFP